MAGISIPGIGSGINIGDLVTSLANAEKAPKQQQINDQTKTATASLSALGTIKGALDTFRAALTKLNTAASFSGLSGTTSDDKIASIKLGDKPSAGTYKLHVEQLATGSKIASKVYENTSKVVNDTGAAQTLTLSQGSATHSINIPAGATLQQARDSINSQLDGKGITANIVTDAEGSRIVYSSTQTGEGTEITLGGDSELANDTTTITKPQNAVFTVDGLKLESKSNTVTGAIGGVDITLSKEGDATLTVSNDTDSLKKSVQTFVTAYNALMTAVNAQTKVTVGTDGEATGSAALTGDATMRSLVSTVRAEITRSVDSSGGGLRVLADLGISTVQKTGLLEFNDKKWDDTAKKLGNSIGEFFTSKDGLLNRMNKATEEFAKTGGILASRQTNLSDQLKSLTEDQAALDRRIESLTDTLTKKYNAMDAIVAQLRATSDSVLTTLNALNKSKD